MTLSPTLFSQVYSCPCPAPSVHMWLLLFATPEAHQSMTVGIF